MRIAVVDDEQSVRDTLKQYLEQFAREEKLRFEIEEFTSGDELIAVYRTIYDIILFDIDMPGTNGMDTARKIRQKDRRVTLLFITNIAQYAINGYEVEAVDYIIKPISYYDFYMKFQRSLRLHSHKVDHLIAVNTVKGFRSLNISDIIYIEVLSHYLIYHTVTDELKARGSMKEQAEQLAVYNFCRVHKCYLVNLKYVDEIKSKTVVTAGQMVPLGRVYKSELMQKYMKYIGG